MRQEMGDESSTAQVHPELLTKALIAAAEAKGAQLRHGIVEGIELDSNKAVQGTVGAINPVCGQHW